MRGTLPSWLHGGDEPRSPGAASLGPVLGHTKGPGVCTFPLACMKGCARLIPESSRNVPSVAANRLCAICL